MGIYNINRNLFRGRRNTRKFTKKALGLFSTDLEGSDSNDNKRNKPSIRPL